jgi:serine protease Do
MKSIRLLGGALALAAALSASPARADDSFADVAEKVNTKMVKLFGSGGIRGLAAYGTGFIVSPDGYVLTVYSHILDTQDLRIHLADGTRYQGHVVATEPELDVALVKIDKLNDKLPYFDVDEAVRRQRAQAGTGILAFSNQFEIATRDDPVSVQQGWVAAYAKLHGKIGIHNAPYAGDVYVVDAITNNPGAAGGALTTQKGELLGIIGKELRNELTNTWINYAVPINAQVTLRLPPDNEHKDPWDRTVSVADLVRDKEKYKPAPKREKVEGGGYLGITFVPKVVDRTPAYIEEVDANSPAAKVGLKPDDLVVYLNGLPVVSVQAFEELLERYRPDETIKLEVRRGDKLTTFELKLAPPKVKPKPKPKDDM